ncbi:LPXTG cell wall anchor domain-containing protein [Anaerosalibacter bizertensis]|uniref:LPXTG cell wall anchor domain-containing protein n=1 Tax=Anaerosalibacter bizertensis TaxID=932217 RepID=A0A844FF04_9FIRM|nr:LPXTG cell wall anchor domain-containing protein [Anaerosalibacter bizertensis]MBU5294569.1 FIVAR domain-containing protein [Anaerosalibacter bizertensis]MSS42565.1 LPXTG cell wall anchor domain-containing protein [Anaerosalibacter bizertensis]
MKKRRIMASFLALLISISSFFNIGFAQTDLNTNVDEKGEKQDNFGFNSYIGDPALSYVPDDWENDIWLTSTYKKGNADHIKMKIGEVDSVYPWRIPQGIVNYINNDVERPNFNFEILQGDSVELLSNSTTDTVDIKAVKKGDTVIKVTYDEFTHSKGKYFPPSSKVNTKYIVYSVGAEQNIDIKTDIETNIAKTIYFVDSKTTPYTFEVNAPGATKLIVTINGKKVSDSSDNKYTVDLENRQNIIGIIAIDDKGKVSTHYEMIEARLIELETKNLTRSDLDEIYDGQDVGISFKGIKLPVPKIATYYNPFMNSIWSQQGEEAPYVEYVVNNDIGKVRSHGGQYDLATNNQIKIENIKAGKHTFSNGKIYEGWWGVELGDHNKRETPDWAGGGIAPSNEIKPRCELPEFVIEVKEKNDKIESPLVDFRLETKEVRLALGSTFQLKPIFKFGENTPEDVKKKYKDVKYSSHLFKLDNSGEIIEDENGYWLTVNEEGLVKVNQNMPKESSPINKNGVAIKAQTIDGKTFICTVRIKKDGEPEPKIEIEKTKLEEVINKAKKVEIEGKTEKSVKALKEAISEGEKVIKKEEITQEEVDKAVKVIEAAINNLEDKEDPGEPEPKPEIDKTKLKETINKAEKIDIKDKTEESIKALNETISRGKEILEKKEATQEEVNNAVKEIEIAISNLKDKEEPEPEIDKTGLEAAISKAEKLEVEDKTVESIKDLNDAISKGKEIFESKTSTQEEVNKTLELLKAAINGLKVKPTDPKEPTNPVEPKDPKDKNDDKKLGVPTKPQKPNKPNKPETINKPNNEIAEPNMQNKSAKTLLPRTGQSSMMWISILGVTLLAIGIWINKRKQKEI